MSFTKFLQKLIMDNEMNRPPAWDSQKGPDRKIKSNLEWPNILMTSCSESKHVEKTKN